jgi:pimeloyl-ACP methyl ester carboxylesterase
VSVFALIHGAWQAGWLWDEVVPELEARGHRAVAPDLPSDDPNAGLSDYARVVTEAIGEPGDDVIAVGHSFGGLTAPLVPAKRLVFVCAHLPQPGRSLAETSAEEKPTTDNSHDGRTVDEQNRDHWFDSELAIRDLYNECDRPTAEAAAHRLRPQSLTPRKERSPLTSWPDVPCHYILGTNERMVRPDWSRQAAGRIGATLHELDSDHTPMLSRPVELAALLTSLV